MALAAPAPMEGHGAYNRNSRVQAGSLSPALPLLETAARLVPLAAGAEPVIVADYGSSEGRNSLLPLGRAVGVLRERTGAGRPLWVVHNDLPQTDYSVLFTTLAEDPESYLRAPDVFAAAVGRSFFGPVLPPGSVTLGWSSWAVQWLSRSPTTIPDHIQAAYSQDPAARAAFAAQAAEDWAAFIAARERELRPGGRLVILAMASDETGAFGYRSVVAATHAAVREMAGDGFMTAAELARMVVPTYARTRQEWLAPFDASGRRGALTLESIDIFIAEDRIWQETGGDADAFGARWAAFGRTTAGPSLAAGLDGGGDARRTAFLGRLEAAMQRLLAAAPEQQTMPLAMLVLAKDS